MTRIRKRFSSKASPDLLAALRTIAEQDGRQFEDVLEHAMRDYIKARRQDKPRTAVMAHFRASVEKNRRLGELLAK